MHSFTDNLGRVWQLSVTVGTIKRVRALCSDLNLLDIISVDKDGKPNADLLEKLGSDPVLLADVLYAVCKPECDQKAVSDEDFGRALAGDAIDAAADNLLEEIVDFFPAAKRMLFRKALAASRRFTEAGNKKLMEMIDSEEFDKKLDSELEKLNGSSTSVPGSAE